MNNDIKAYRDEIKSFNLLYINYINNKIKESGLDEPSIEPYNDTELNASAKYVFNMKNDEESKLYIKESNVLVNNVLELLPVDLLTKVNNKQIDVFSIETLMSLIDLYFEAKIKIKESPTSNKFISSNGAVIELGFYDIINEYYDKDLFSGLVRSTLLTSFIDFYINNKELVENSLK